MNDWQVLGIAPGADAKAIRRAYAARVKQTRPDQDPDGFQRLHGAYKRLLARAPASLAADTPAAAAPQPSTADEPAPAPSASLVAAEAPANGAASNDDQHADKLDASRLSPPRPVPEEIEEPLELILERDWRNLFEQIDTLLADKAQRLRPEAWRFIEQCPSLVDIEFKAQAAFALFELIAREEVDENQRAHLLPVEVRRYLDSIFHWTDRRAELDARFEPEQIDRVLDKLPPLAGSAAARRSRFRSSGVHRGPVEVGGYYQRIAAMLVDVLICLPLVWVLKWTFALELSLVLDAVGLYLLACIVLEATAWQGTPGKWLFKLKVVTRKGRRMNILHSLLRTFVFLLSLVGIKITVWINLFSRDGRLIHDRLSFSQVIKH